MSTRRQAAANAALKPTHEPRSPIPFRERVAALAGHTTWREPAGELGPRDIDIAGALSFGRSGPGDIGPDIAFDMATGHPAHYRRCVLWLGEQLGSLATHDADGYYPARACKAHLAPVALHAYNAIVRGWACPPHPEDVRDRDWQELLLFACLLLEQSAEDALALAARRRRG